jgi:hypothetical protein
MAIGLMEFSAKKIHGSMRFKDANSLLQFTESPLSSKYAGAAGCIFLLYFAHALEECEMYKETSA